ncbi:MAG: agmatine deiminase family protein [Saprospiraceae bacterium]
MERITHQYRTPFDRPYRIMPLEMPADNGQYPPQGDYLTYTNSVFINGMILVPIYGIPQDEAALDTYRTFFRATRCEASCATI